MLFSGLEREAERPFSIGVFRGSRNTARHPAKKRLGRDKVSEIGTAERHRHPERLSFPRRDVRTPFPGGTKEGKRGRMSGKDQKGFVGVDLIRDPRKVLDDPEEIRGLKDHARRIGIQLRGETLAVKTTAGREPELLDATGAFRKVGADDFPVMRMNGPGNEDLGTLRVTQRDKRRFGKARRAVIMKAFDAARPVVQP